MTYVALLRGVNVGGTGTISMKELAAVFEATGMTSVRTYINSGNVIFQSQVDDAARLAATLEDAIEKRFDFAVCVVVRSRDEMAAIVAAISADWTNDAAMRCDVFFLWPEADRPSVVELLPHDPAVDDVRYVPGAVIHRVDRENVMKSKITRIVGTPLYKQMTIRNCNTARKLLELMGG
jgi:uncharacterized protein (DUF1697 family)